MAKRRDVFDPTDPANLQPEQRLHEVAAILATGVIRTRENRAATTPRVRAGRHRDRRTGLSKRPRGGMRRSN